MAIKHGTTTISAVKHGSTTITKTQHNNTQVTDRKISFSGTNCN
jgi:hypothetical protein